MSHEVDVELDVIADELAAQHVAYFAENPGGGLLQSCFSWLPGGDTVSLPCGWEGPEQRRAVIAGLRLFMEAFGVTRYAIWAEVWLVRAKVPPGSTIEQAAASFGENTEYGDLSRHPERVEAVFTIVVDRAGRIANRLQRVVRGDGGEVLRLEPMPPQDGLAGALAHLLPRTVH